MKQYISILFVALLTGCESIIEVAPPKTEVPYDNVFATDANVLLAISGVYQQMGQGVNFASGSLSSVTMLAGLSSDEIRNYYDYNLDFIQFEDNIISPANPLILPLWTSAYETIYRANSIIEGLANSVKVTAAVKTQIEGEAYFIRAFTHFYLTSLYGDVPIVLTTDYRTNSEIPKQSQENVFAQIISDLLRAKERLKDAYPSTERVRPNKSTAGALLSRVYLYLSKWDLAEQEASEIIQKTDQYAIINLNEVFLTNSMEAIWQLMPSNGAFNTHEGNTFLMLNGPESVLLRDEMVNTFEAEDLRRFEWMDSIPDPNDASIVLYYPSKYKVKVGTTLTEYSMVFRLAEQYLIRAEARAKQDKLELAISDVDVLRKRAGLTTIETSNPTVPKDDLILSILQERRVELFTEWGHRWFDLKRTDHADAVLQPIKENWKSTAVLYPLPQAELNTNRQLGLQNTGY